MNYKIVTSLMVVQLISSLNANYLGGIVDFRILLSIYVFIQTSTLIVYSTIFENVRLLKESVTLTSSPVMKKLALILLSALVLLANLFIFLKTNLWLYMAGAVLVFIFAFFTYRWHKQFRYVTHPQAKNKLKWIFLPFILLFLGCLTTNITIFYYSKFIVSVSFIIILSSLLCMHYACKSEWLVDLRISKHDDKITTSKKSQELVTISTDTLTQIAINYQCPVVMIGPHQVISSSEPFTTSRIIDISKESLRMVNKIVTVDGANPLISQKLAEHGIEAIYQLWIPPNPAWGAWLIFGEGFRRRCFSRSDYYQLITLLDPLRRLYIDEITNHQIASKEREAQISNMKRRISVLRSKHEEPQNKEVSQYSLSSVVKREPNENLLTTLIYRYQRRMINIALTVSHGKLEAAAHYLKMNYINLVRLKQKINVEN